MKPKKWKSPNFFVALKHSVDGIKYTIRSERNIKIQLIFAFCAIVFGIFLKLSLIEFVLLILTIALVLFAEFVNTAVEFLFDLYSEEYHEKIKYGKDIASGAVLITSIVSVIVGIILFLPKILIILV